MSTFRPSDGFLLEKVAERTADKSPELLEIERKQRERAEAAALRELDARIVETSFTTEELKQLSTGFAVDVAKIVGKPVLRLHSRPENVISLREVKAARHGK